jgi:hypothetical protein
MPAVDEDGAIDDDDKPPELMIVESLAASLAYCNNQLVPFYLTSLYQLYIM